MSEAHESARLYVLAGPDLARSFALGERTTLGRAEECDVVLSDRSISRKHAVLVRQGEAWFVQDLGSTNGVSKDGRRGERFELADGDEFKLGDLPLRLRLTAEPAAQEIEFELAAPAAAVAPREAPRESPRAAPVARSVAAQPAAKAAPAAGPDVDVEEIEIEEPDAPAPAGRPRPALEATVYRPPRAARRSGFFSSDLAQQPFWMRCLVALGVLLLGACLAYGAFQAVQLLRAGL